MSKAAKPKPVYLRFLKDGTTEIPLEKKILIKRIEKEKYSVQ
jgi:hypothetical protein